MKLNFEFWWNFLTLNFGGIALDILVSQPAFMMRKFSYFAEVMLTELDSLIKQFPKISHTISEYLLKIEPEMKRQRINLPDQTSV